MSIARRGKTFYLRIRPFGEELITVRTSAVTKAEAVRIERDILVACRAQDYRALDPMSREAFLTMFRNRGWEIPPDLAGEEPVKEELTLWKAVEIFLNYPTMKNSATKERYIYCVRNIVRKWGKDRPIKSLWSPDLRLYQVERQNEGASPATVNKELSVLSRMFGVLIELQLVESNPCRLTKKLSEKSGERQVYISFEDFQRILEHLPTWFVTIAQTAYYTGMRRGEIVGLTRRQVDLKRRIITLQSQDTKERKAKRIPIHRELVPILAEVMKVQAIGTDNIVLHNGEPVTHRDQMRWCWERKACKAGIEPTPRFHDLRATWRTNARRSGMHPEIEKAIMGHADRSRSVHERYGTISDQELIAAIDLMTFDHGATEIWVAKR